MVLITWTAVGALYRRLMPAPLVVGRIDHDGMAEAFEPVVRRLADPPMPLSRRRVPIAIGGSFLAFAGYVAIEALPPVTPVILGITTGVIAVGYGTARLVYDEWAADGAVHDDLADLADVPETDAQNGDRGGNQMTARTDLQQRIDRLAKQAAAPAPTVELGRSRTPVAAAVGYRPSSSTIVVSRGLCDRLEDRELDAVLAHELTHVINHDAAVLTALSLPAAKVEPLAEEDPDPRVAGPHTGFLLFLAVPIMLVTSLAVTSLARYREYVADRGAVALTGDPAALASALETLDRETGRRPDGDLRSHRSTAAFSIVPPPWEEYRFFDRSRRFVRRRLFGTHPPTQTRLERLRKRISG
ncbi:M48 family metallopeptidase [Natronosalvus rutilus]|uniref:M48 family metalloprotease n=1 Tax=Natronosalvus rutilus TaxID=2953753 RepID=A0A9E7NF64_9EURY|nr:M48 family metalloprotease [Natronosalvus rutilus]UTF55642.1 M48 family metalloprotease [Natronosalvus rutilus]